MVYIWKRENKKSWFISYCGEILGWRKNKDDAVKFAQKQKKELGA